jgi:hypothetical protein
MYNFDTKLRGSAPNKIILKQKVAKTFLKLNNIIWKIDRTKTS